MLDQSYFFTRITGLMRCVFMMGFLIPYNINSMSAFSFSLELAVRGIYFHPQVSQLQWRIIHIYF